MKTALRELVTLRRGNSYQGALVGEVGAPLLGLGTIAREGGFKGSKLRHYPEEFSDRIAVKAGDVYVALKDMTQEAALLGAAARVPDGFDRARLTQDTIAVDILEDAPISRSFLYWTLRSPQCRAHCKSLGTGTTNLDLGRDDFLSYEFWLPSTKEQALITEVLGALVDKIAANRDVSIRAEALAVAVASKCSHLVRLGEVAQQRRSSLSPMKLGSETVLHYSLPAFDEGKATLESAEEIKSAKNEIENPAVLISKLNPKIPRLWPVDTAASSVRRLASSEFVVLESSELGVGELWAAILHGDVFGQLQSIVGGTSNSHQRVRPQDVLDAVVPDTRVLDQADRKLLVSLCRLRSQLVEANDSLARTRDELLPLLMNGRIKVRDAEHAVEGVL